MTGKKSFFYKRDNSNLDKTLLILIILLIISQAWQIYSLNESKKETNIIRRELEAMINSLFKPPNTISVNDFLTKLTAHNELTKYRGIVPDTIVQINQQNLVTLAQQITGLDQSYIGAFIIQYPEEIIIYDLGNDKIIAQLTLPNIGTKPKNASQE
jgi:hypothetical protein